MKRYQCIKNVIDLDHEGESYIAFKAGNLYSFFTIEDTDLLGVIDMFGNTHTVDEELGFHFQELLDLNVDDHEEEQYTAMLPSKKALGTGCAIVVAAILTIIITLISII